MSYEPQFTISPRLLSLVEAVAALRERIQGAAVELSWIHLSHARLAGSYNPGVGDVGLRVLYRYGLDR